MHPGKGRAQPTGGSELGVACGHLVEFVILEGAVRQVPARDVWVWFCLLVSQLTKVVSSLRALVSERLQVVLASQWVHRQRWVPLEGVPFFASGAWWVIHGWVCPVGFTLMD